MGTDQDRGAWTSLVLLERFQGGDDRAAEQIFGRYFQRLTALARGRLSPRLAQRTDPEDVVLSAYRSFFVDARAGRYVLGRGGDLWRLLAAVTKHKLLRQVRRQNAARRSVGAEVPIDQVDERRFAGAAGDPSPEEAVALADELERVLSLLDAFGRRVLELRLRGLEMAEIAEETGRSERSVRRVIDRVRHILAARSEGQADVPGGLQRAHEGLPGEPASPGPDPRPPTPGRNPRDPVEADPGGPLLSHTDFLLRRLIGAGRMGKVYEARQHGSNRDVAVKFLRRSFLDRPEVVRRFIGEARTVAGLRHPNIVGTEGLGRTPGGAYFIVMELVRGLDLARLAGQRAVAPQEAVRWLLDACEALEHSHERGVVHCDLKPANLILDEGGTVRVTDFGLARSLAGDTPWAAELEGTAPFMAPEQAARCWGPIDRRTDVYGLGAVLFALLTGRPPFIGRRLADVLAQVVSARPVDSPAAVRTDIPESLCEACLRCLAKDPAARFATVGELRSALGRESV